MATEEQSLDFYIGVICGALASGNGRGELLMRAYEHIAEAGEDIQAIKAKMHDLIGSHKAGGE